MLGLPPQQSFRHARKGEVGVDGQLPLGWLGESIGSIIVQDVATGPTIQLSIETPLESAQDFFSLVIGPFLRPRLNEVYLCKIELSCLDAQNVEAAYLL